MKNKERVIILGDLDKILDLSFKYCKHDNKKIGEAARGINDKAYETMKYVDRYLKAKKKKRKAKKKK
jgi:hypothetical protein